MADTNPAQPLAAVKPPASGTPAGSPPASSDAPSKPEAGLSDALTVADIKAKNELRKEMQRVAQAREALAKEKAEVDEFKKRQALAALDPDGFLKPVYGEKWYETLTKAKLGDDSNLAVQQLKQEVESRFRVLRDEEDRRTKEDAQRAAEEKAHLEEEQKAALDDYRTEATSFVKEKADDYQVINALGLEGSIADKTQAHYTQTKKVLSHKEAADLLEQELDKAVEKVLTTKKWQERLGKAPAIGSPQPGTPRSAPSTSVDNSLRAGAAPQNQRPSREEKYANAMKRLDEWEAARKAQAS